MPPPPYTIWESAVSWGRSGQQRGGLRILQVISSPAASGAERHCVDISLAFRRRGLHVETAVPPGSWLAKELREGGCPVHEVDFRASKGLGAIRDLTRIARTQRFDVIHSHLSRASTAAWAAGKITRTPLAATVHIRSKGLIYRTISRSGGWVIAVSEYIRSVLMEGGVKASRCLVVTNGTDFADKTPAEGPTFRQELGLTEGHILAGLVGRVAREKGQHLAVEALALLAEKIPNLHLAFVGRISQEEFASRLGQRVKELGLEDRIHLTGPRSDIPRVLDSLDFTIMPSEMEACPLAALESMSRGRPLVAAKVGGLVEMVPHQEVGVLVELDPREIASGIEVLSLQKETREKMSARAREWVAAKYSWDKMLDGLEGVYLKAATK
jgi:glycosyltransferase involved in cell wall biosynthesis